MKYRSLSGATWEDAVKDAKEALAIFRELQEAECLGFSERGNSEKIPLEFPTETNKVLLNPLYLGGKVYETRKSPQQGSIF